MYLRLLKTKGFFKIEERMEVSILENMNLDN